MYDQLTISFGQWDYRLFAPEIESYCDILLNRIDPIFADVDAEQERAAEQFMNAAASWYGDDYQGAAEAAYEHARDTALQFMEMRAVFMATGVSGLFHLFEKQLYKHINNELKHWLKAPITSWQDLEKLIPKFDHKRDEQKPCIDLINAFRDSDLQELRLVANAVKHGNDGPSYKQLVENRAVVVSQVRLKDDWTAGDYSVLRVNISVQSQDAERYQAALLRFWKLEGTFWASRSAFL
jgi:hypothetical protein